MTVQAKVARCLVVVGRPLQLGCSTCRIIDQYNENKTSTTTTTTKLKVLQYTSKRMIKKVEDHVEGCRHIGQL